MRRIAYPLLSLGVGLVVLQGPAALALQGPAATWSPATAASTSASSAARSGAGHKAAPTTHVVMPKAWNSSQSKPRPRGTSTTIPTKHFIVNLQGSKAPAQLGFDVFDINAGSWALDALPPGVQGLVYVGQKCPTPADRAFKATVDKLAKSSKVYGYYLSDEPHIGDCASGPSALASRADYIRNATSGRQKSFIVLSQPQDYRPFRPALTHVDLVGLDPYPCSVAHAQCDLSKVGEKVQAATSAGILVNQIVPVYQAFGQTGTSDHYYNLPTVEQMRGLLAAWGKWVPNPQMDYTYSWGNQSSSNPTLVNSQPLQKLFQQQFAK